jgi:hypothetical protein
MNLLIIESKLRYRRDKNIYKGGVRARRQLIGTVEEATVPGRAVHRPANTYKRSLYMSRGHVGQLIGTVEEAAVPE